MAGLLDPNEDFISPDERKAITQQNLFSALLQGGMQLVAGGENLLPWQRAQMIGQAAQTFGGMPAQNQQMLANAAQQKLVGQRVAKDRRTEAADAELMKVGENPAFLETLKQMPADLQSMIPALFKSGRARDAVTLVDNWRTNQARETALTSRENQPIVREVNGQIYRVYPDGRPAELIQTGGGKALDNSGRDDLKKVADPAIALRAIAGEFQPAYSGMGAGILGDARNFIGRNFADEDSDTFKGANWWQGYQSFANLERNKLFGAALTATEKVEWGKAMVNPGMSPAMIKTNLARQQEIATGAVSRIAHSLKAGGVNPDAIEPIMGTKFSDLPNPIQSAPPSAAQGGTANIPAGAINHLKQNPGLRDAFDQKYGPGAADRVLGR